MGAYYPSHNYGPEHAAALRTGAVPTTAPRRHASQRQIAANRRNAQKSTGPRTEAGKSRCALNALRNGVTGQISSLTAEDRAAHEAFCAPLIADLRPEGAVEGQLAHAIADGHWRLNRIRAVEDNIFALGHFGPPAEINAGHPELHGALTSARVFLDSAKEFERLTLYEQRIQRGIDRNMAQLQALQTERRAQRERQLQEAAALHQVAEFNGETASAEDTSGPNGFVFSIDEIRQCIRRRERLKAAIYLAKCDWDPAVSYPLSV